MAEDPIPVLNHLVEVCRNGQHGFREAALSVHDRHLAAVFLEISEQRDQFAAQLRYEVSKLGGRPEDHGTAAGVLHRRWMELRSALSGDRAVIAECARGEEAALRAYEEASRAALPPELAKIIASQHAQIRTAWDTVQTLEVKLRQEPCF